MICCQNIKNYLCQLAIQQRREILSKTRKQKYNTYFSAKFWNIITMKMNEALLSWGTALTLNAKNEPTAMLLFFAICCCIKSIFEQEILHSLKSFHYTRKQKMTNMLRCKSFLWIFHDNIHIKTSNIALE